MQSNRHATVPLLIEDLHKSFAEIRALDGVSLSLEPGRVLALLGPSGCGKTTLLRCIAGLMTPDSGRITIGGMVMNEGRQSRPPEARELGMVFQDYALWPHMTVAENVGFPLAMRRYSRGERNERVHWALETVGLNNFVDRAPETLSGGQQQRVALARAIVSRPRLLLMDEPLSNLDKGLRESLALDIRRLINQLNLSAVFVTHDQHEAFALADEVAILQNGQLKQVATPKTLYDSPANPGIADFLDAGVLIRGRFTSDAFIADRDDLTLPFRAKPRYSGAGTLLLPRRAMQLTHAGRPTTKGRIQAVLFQGEHYAVRLQLGHETAITLHSQDAPVVDSEIGIHIEDTAIRAWDADDRELSVTRTDSGGASSARITPLRSGYKPEQHH